MIAETGEVPAFPEVQPFAYNWSYLKAELALLDRVLMRSLAKQRQNNQEVDRVAKSAADRATNHWWKGFIAIDPSKGGVSPQKIHLRLSIPLGAMAIASKLVSLKILALQFLLYAIV